MGCSFSYVPRHTPDNNLRDIRYKLGPIGLATAAGANNFLGKNKNLTRTSFIVTAECLPCLRGTEWCNLQCVCICVQ